MEVLTIGSGSRLLFDLYNTKQIKLVSDIFKSNILSLMSEEMEDDYLVKEDNKTVKDEVIKYKYKKLITSAKKPDLVIVDFLDEMYDSLKYKNSYITYNFDVKTSINGYINRDKFTLCKNIFNNEWESYCLKFISVLKKIFCGKPIILHEIYLAEEYYKGSELLSFQNKNEIKLINEELRKKYEFFKKSFKEIRIIKIKENYADFNHKYSLLPYLMCEKYYENLSNAILRENKPIIQLEVEQYSDIKREELNVGIMGSCDSRDIFRVYEEYNFNSTYNINEYYARSSVISLVSKSTDYAESNINLQSNFKKKSLFRDLNKSFITDLENISSQLDFLVIDFMEERFDIIKTEETFITRSWEFRESNLQSELFYTLIDRFDTDLEKIWEKCCLIFIEHLRKYFKPNQIILNKVGMVDKYIKNNDVNMFDNHEHIQKFNKLLDHYNTFFQENFPGIHVISGSRINWFCDSNHLWGCFPYHFNDEYYLELEEQIRNIFIE
jgi:hypothetical protein